MVVRAVGIISGGLDSMLACRVLMEQDIEVTAITFTTPFFGSARGEAAASALGVEHIVMDITEDHLRMVKSPRYGYGKNMNPCIDCHAMMFTVAAGVMREISGQFLFSGEVLGQRPMSQNPKALRLVEKESGCEGIIVRPLSAKLLPETEAERQEFVDRNGLLDIQGRSRKRQMELASAFGLNEFPTPGGGCLLTDPGFSVRLRELFEIRPDADATDVKRLKVGRHFRLPGGGKAIVGRHLEDNDELEKLFRPGDHSIQVEGITGPMVLAEDGADEPDLKIAASLAIRYSKAVKDSSAVVIVKSSGGIERKITAAPADSGMIRAHRIG